MTTEVTISQLQKQQQELLKIQNMIQMKMSTIQSAIIQKESRGSKAIKANKDFRELNMHDRSILSQTIDSERPPTPELLNKSCISISDYSSHQIDTTVNEKRVLQITTSKYTTKEDSIPLFNAKTRCKSVTKQRRTRKERFNQQSSERQCEESYYTNKSVIKSNLNASFSAKFESKIPSIMHQPKTRTTLCSKERSTVSKEHSHLALNKCYQVEKAANVISKKTFDILKRVRPIQSSVLVIRLFIKVLKLYNSRLCLFNEKDNLAKMLNALSVHSNIIIKEVKLL